MVCMQMVEEAEVDLQVRQGREFEELEDYAAPLLSA